MKQERSRNAVINDGSLDGDAFALHLGRSVVLEAEHHDRDVSILTIRRKARVALIG